MIIELYPLLAYRRGEMACRPSVIPARRIAFDLDMHGRSLARVMEIGKAAPEPGITIAVIPLQMFTQRLRRNPEVARRRMVIEAGHLFAYHEGVGRGYDDGANMGLHAAA